MESIPQKRIKSPEDLTTFFSLPVYAKYVEFVIHLRDSVKSRSIKSTPRLPEYKIYEDFFTELSKKLAETPANPGPMHFGNTAFKDFHAKAVETSKNFCEKLVASLKVDPSYAPELQTYLNDCWGSEIRIDYGTGHELNFMVFLFCVNSLVPFPEENYGQVVHQIFYDYIFLMRKVQLQYNLEPAGSHGVWGLDDYHFLPFIFGGSELIDHPVVKVPDSIHKLPLLEEFGDDYMYLNCIQFIMKVKKSVPFGVSSPMLNDISAAESWQKVANGMVKMYEAEVLKKFPVVQHLKFGRLFPFAN